MRATEQRGSAATVSPRLSLLYSAVLVSRVRLRSALICTGGRVRTGLAAGGALRSQSWRALSNREETRSPDAPNVQDTTSGASKLLTLTKQADWRADWHRRTRGAHKVGGKAVGVVRDCTIRLLKCTSRYPSLLLTVTPPELQCHDRTASCSLGLFGNACSHLAP